MDALHLPRKLDRGNATLPTLAGTSNYSTWKKAIRMLFAKVGVLPVIEIDRPVDADELWAKCDRWAFSEIFFSCSPEQQLNLEEGMSAKHSWDTLANLFQSPSLGNIFRLTMEFNALKQRPDQPAMQFMTSVVLQLRISALWGKMSVTKRLSSTSWC